MVHLTPVRPGVSRSFFQLCFQQPASGRPGGGLRGTALKLWKALQTSWLVGARSKGYLARCVSTILNECIC